MGDSQLPGALVRPESGAGVPDTSISREELYRLVWYEPMHRVAETLGVSPVILRKACADLRVPRPGAGYWAKFNHAKAAPRPPLPAALEGDLVSWSPAAEIRAANAAAAGPPQHELLAGVKPHFLRARSVLGGILRPHKRLLVDIVTSQAKLDDALDAAGALFGALHEKGFHVGLASADRRTGGLQANYLDLETVRNQHATIWIPGRPTVAHMGETPIGLTLFEIVEEVEVVRIHGEYFPARGLPDDQLKRLRGPDPVEMRREMASGRLTLLAYGPSRLAWSKQWVEGEPRALAGMAAGIADELEAVAADLSQRLPMPHWETEVYAETNG